MDDTGTPLPGFEDIQRAAVTIRAAVCRTPAVPAPSPKAM